MGMSTRIVGYKKADEEWIKKKQIWDLCIETSTAIPHDITSFFKHEYPGDKIGQEIKLPDTAFTEIAEDMVEGYQIEIDKIPDGIHFIRVTNHY